ncbi:hypothetical protein [Sporolactobacillus laevolacticus]|uniref:hypothetical protein n=1 Tax=Sporolactobacillus laevolacticus TaxID=33018 RepID=UPI0025B34DC2|nr:hypothetical protein [Sporolactobacillus laevolacticus]MDN3955901.1 hypothetical protein [Sporolactobacillus laevolacticus]
MFPVLRYQAMNYFRSYLFVPPFVIYTVLLFVNYSYRPNPIMDSYALTSILGYLLAAWFTISVFHVEEKVQETIAIVHLKSMSSFYIWKFAFVALIGVLLSVISTLFPIAFGMFDERITFPEISIGFLSHFLLFVLSMSFTSLMTRRLVKNSANTWLGTCFMLAITLAAPGIMDILPKQLQPMMNFLPPVYPLLKWLESAQSPLFTLHAALLFLWIIGYSLVLMILFMFLIHLKRTS